MGILLLRQVQSQEYLKKSKTLNTTSQVKYRSANNANHLSLVS